MRRFLDHKALIKVSDEKPSDWAWLLPFALWIDKITQEFCYRNHLNLIDLWSKANNPSKAIYFGMDNLLLLFIFPQKLLPLVIKIYIWECYIQIPVGMW